MVISIIMIIVAMITIDVKCVAMVTMIIICYHGFHYELCATYGNICITCVSMNTYE